MSIDLFVLHDAIEGGLREQLPGCFVEMYSPIERRIQAPAILIELSEMNKGDDPGTGETGLIGRFAARIVVDPNEPRAMVIVTALAAKVASVVNGKTWGLPVSAAELVGDIGEDSAKPDLDGYIVWVVEWTHQFNVGEEEWPFEDDTGKTVMLGVYPETGEGREDRYWPLGAAPPDDWGEQKK